MQTSDYEVLEPALFLITCTPVLSGYRHFDHCIKGLLRQKNTHIMLGTAASAVVNQTAALLVPAPLGLWATCSVTPSGGGDGVELTAPLSMHSNRGRPDNTTATCCSYIPKPLESAFRRRKWNCCCICSTASHADSFSRLFEKVDFADIGLKGELWCSD